MSWEDTSVSPCQFTTKSSRAAPTKKLAANSAFLSNIQVFTFSPFQMISCEILEISCRLFNNWALNVSGWWSHGSIHLGCALLSEQPYWVFPVEYIAVLSCFYVPAACIFVSKLSADNLSDVFNNFSLCIIANWCPLTLAEEYVTCHTCRSPETILQKDTRLYFLQCETCHSRCSVASIKTGFQAVTGKRAQLRAKAN